MKPEDIMNAIEDRWETFRESDAGFFVTLLPGWAWIFIVSAILILIYGEPPK